MADPEPAGYLSSNILASTPQGLTAAARTPNLKDAAANQGSPRPLTWTAVTAIDVTFATTASTVDTMTTTVQDAFVAAVKSYTGALRGEILR